MSPLIGPQSRGAARLTTLLETAAAELAACGLGNAATLRPQCDSIPPSQCTSPARYWACVGLCYRRVFGYVSSYSVSQSNTFLLLQPCKTELLHVFGMSKIFEDSDPSSRT